jgi:hypothetical protein
MMMRIIEIALLSGKFDSFARVPINSDRRKETPDVIESASDGFANRARPAA